MLLWKSHFSKNESSVLIRLPHSETVHVFHYTQQEISQVTLMPHSCPLQPDRNHLLEAFHLQLSLHSATLGAMPQHLHRWWDLPFWFERPG